MSIPIGVFRTSGRFVLLCGNSGSRRLWKERQRIVVTRQSGRDPRILIEQSHVGPLPWRIEMNWLKFSGPPWAFITYFYCIGFVLGVALAALLEVFS